MIFEPNEDVNDFKEAFVVKSLGHSNEVNNKWFRKNKHPFKGIVAAINHSNARDLKKHLENKNESSENYVT